jgi:hypothetical protein
MERMGQTLDRLWSALLQIVAVLPGMFLALVILGAGFLVARTLERLLDAALGRTAIDRQAAEWGVAEAVRRSGVGGPSQVVGKLVFWFVMLVVILLASSALGVENINDVFANLIGYLPSLFAAIIVIILGIILGEFVRALILASAGGVEGVPMLARVAKGMVVLISVFMALTQLGVAADIVTTAFTLILGAAALAVALAFGLGSRDLAAEIIQRWYETGRVKFGRRSGDRTASPAVPPDAGSPPGA